MTLEFHTPDWVKEAVFYQIFPDRFASSPRVIKPNNLEPWHTPPTVHGFKGGDLLGVAEHLDYLQDLGINAIYFTPIFQSASNHRYHTHDYFKVDPILGGGAAFKMMLDACHQRGIRVVLDGVFNHASRGFFQFNHILETSSSSPYIDWFDIKRFPLNAYEGEPNYGAWIGLPALPQFNHQNPQVREFIFNVARYWLEQGIDGWRLDVPYCIDDDRFWQEFRQVVKEANPEAYIVGEIAHNAQRWLQGDQFDAVMNYLFTYACLGFFSSGSFDQDMARGMMGVQEFPPLDAPQFARQVEDLLTMYPYEAAQAQLNLLDSHDTPRFLTLARGDKSALKLATLFQFTYVGAPCIYYGDEIGLEGGRDPDCRRSFPWDPAAWDMDLRAYIQHCVALRKSSPALLHGEFRSLLANGAVYAFARLLGEQTMVVALNTDTHSQSFEVPVSGLWAEGAALVDRMGGPGAAVVDGKVRLSLPGRTGAVYGL